MMIINEIYLIVGMKKAFFFLNNSNETPHIVHMAQENANSKHTCNNQVWNSPFPQPKQIKVLVHSILMKSERCSNIFHDVSQGCKEDRDRFFLVESDRTWGSGNNLEHGNVLLIFIVRVTEHWNSCPREVVESLSSERLKTCLDMVLSKQLLVALLELGPGSENLQRCLPTSTILWLCEKNLHFLAILFFLL